MAYLWIVHRDPRWREALRQLVGRIAANVGSPSDPNQFEGAALPRAVLLGVAGDFEAELEFAHRFSARLGSTLWVLLVRERDRAEAVRLFDALPTALVALSSDAATLRRELAAALARHPEVPALTARSRRDELARRFRLFTDDLDPRLFLAATDPARAALPVLVRGEAGTGRTLVARYLQQVTSRDPRDAFVVWRSGIVSELQVAGGTPTICVEDIDRLDLEAQRRLRDWIEHGMPTGLGASRVRWMATAGPTDDALDPALAQALGGHALRLPPLRERPAAIDTLTHATRRRFAPEALAHLRAHPWPGNLRELDAVLRRTLAATSSDPIAPDDLRFDPGILDPDDFEPPSGAGQTPTPPKQPAPIEAAATIVPEQHAQAEDPASSIESSPVSLPPASIHRLSSAIAHEVGNPLVGIRTYASLLATRFDDPEFRTQFRERIDEDTRRIESVIATLSELGEFQEPAREPVDATALLAGILERSRPQVRERRLVVLEELDREHPLVLGDAAQLGFALQLLLESALAWVPPRGALYVSTRRQPATSGLEARLRIELRMRGNRDGLGFEAQSLAVAVTDAVVRAHAGTLTSEARADGETSIQIELPAPENEA